MIGDTTCGKPYGFLPTDNCGRTYYTIQFRSVNDKGFGDYSISRELGDPEEALLAAALYYRENDSCPAPAATAKSYSRAAKSTTGSVDNGFAIKAIGDPFETTVDSFLDATMPSDAP